MCPRCLHKLKLPPTTGICPKCNEYSYGFEIIKNKNINYKIKMYGYLIVSLLFIITALIFWGENIDSYNSTSGGKSIYILLPLVLLVSVSAVFVKKSIALSVGLLSMSIIFFILAYRNFKKQQGN